MIKKIVLLLSILLLTSCFVNKKYLYKITIDDIDIYVGYSKKDILDNYDFEYEVNDKDIITKLTVYPKDLSNPIYLDNNEIDSSISVNKEMYKGYESNGCAIIDKRIIDKINRVIFYNNILNDDLDELDHITITFE